MKLDIYRQEIDRLDREIIDSLVKRLEVCQEIGRIKEEEGFPIYDPKREREKIEEIQDLVPEEMENYMRIFYSTLMEVSKDHQRKHFGQDSKLVQVIKKTIAENPLTFPKSAVVACQGVLGAYSQQACDVFFKSPRVLYTKNFKGVFAALDAGLCQYGVLPLENSTAGSVNQIYDLLEEYNFYIVRSLKLRVDHALLGKKTTKLENVREIISHEQGILQCEEYLKNFPLAKVTMCENTAEAAKLVSESDRDDIVALASYQCGKLYGLVPLDEKVQDYSNNFTRFICISKKLEIYPGANKASLMMVLSHKPGSLYSVLSRFNALGINISKLESRALPDRDFDYRFYFDFEAEVYSEEFIRLMNQLEGRAQEIKYLGSYCEIS